MKKFRKGLCLFLTAAMLLSFLPAFSIGAFAAESDSTFDVWDGSVASGFAGGIGTEDDPYVIETAEQLAYFAKAVNSSYSKHCFENEFVVLKSNIDLNNRKWVPIGAWSSDHGFKGTFDGQGHVIKNLLVQSYSYYYGGTGFFGSANVIRNLGIINSEIRAHGNTGTDTGAIAGQANIVDGCYNTGMVAGDNNESYTGGIVGICYEAVVNCYNTGNIYGSGYRGSVGARGGIVGWARGSVINCFNTGDVTGLVKTGGIVGLGSGTFWGDGGCTIKNCYNTGDMIGTSTENPGGIAGETWENSTISNCYNSSTSYKCGIVGLFYSEGSTISNCYYLYGSSGRKGTILITDAEMMEKLSEAGFDSNGKKNDFLSVRCQKHQLVTKTTTVPVCNKKVGEELVSCQNEGCPYTFYRELSKFHDYSNHVVQDNYLIPTCPWCEEESTLKVKGLKAECKDGLITVSWNDLGYGWKYYIQILDENLRELKLKNTTTSSITIGGFEDGKTYGFRVYAYKDSTTAYESDRADIVLVKYENPSGEVVIPPQTTNTKVSNVVASVDEERLNISWNAFKDASGYYVYVFENGKQITCKNAGTSTSVSLVDGLKAGVDYTVKVIAKVGSKYQSKDNADEVAGRIKEKISKVQNVTASTNETRLNVYWDAVDGAETYYVYVYENGKQITTKNAGTNTSISIIDGLVEETDYTVKVIAKVDGKYMSKDDATVASGRICAKSPDKVYVTENNPGTVKIAWKAINGANEYYVRVTDEYGYKKVTRTSNTNLTLGGLDAGGKYNVEVAVQIKRTATNGSNTYTTLNYGAINEITVAEPVSISVNAEADGNGVKVSWSAPEKATTYYVYEKVGDTWKVLITLNNPETAEINIKNAASGEHTYSVIARLNYNGANIYTERFISNTITL